MCDFCGQQYDRLWGYWIRAHGVAPMNNPFNRVELVEPQYWCACVQCNALTDNPMVLAARAATMLEMPQTGPYFVWLHTAVLSAWAGEIRE